MKTISVNYKNSSHTYTCSTDKYYILVNKFHDILPHKHPSSVGWRVTEDEYNKIVNSSDKYVQKFVQGANLYPIKKSLLDKILDRDIFIKW